MLKYIKFIFILCTSFLFPTNFILFICLFMFFLCCSHPCLISPPLYSAYILWFPWNPRKYDQDSQSPQTSLLESILVKNSWWIPSTRCSVRLLTDKWEVCKSILLSHLHDLTTSGSFAGALCPNSNILKSVHCIVKGTDLFCIRLWGKISTFVSKSVYY